jgi:hypothetical protein
MKNNFKVFFIALTLLIYCFAVGYHFEYQKYSHNIDSDSKINNTTFISSELFCLQYQTETSVSGNIHVFTYPRFKNQFIGFGMFAQDIESLFSADISSYLSISRKILINSRKFDLIFPFDYFW